MFNNIGGKIKTLAKVLCWIGIAASVIGGLYTFSESQLINPVGIILYLIIDVLSGSLISWLSSLVLYGFGELIEKATSMESKISRIDESFGNLTVYDLMRKDAEVKQTVAIDYSCHAICPTGECSKGKCAVCDDEDVNVERCYLTTDEGIRYVNICDSCIKNFKNNISE